jgi:hypothetical protein
MLVEDIIDLIKQYCITNKIDVDVDLCKYKDRINYSGIGAIIIIIDQELNCLYDIADRGWYNYLMPNTFKLFTINDFLKIKRTEILKELL